MKFDPSKMELNLLTLDQRYKYIGSIVDKLIPIIINKLGKFNRGVYVDSSGLNLMKINYPNNDFSSKCGCLSFDKITGSYAILLNEYCVLTYYIPTLNYTLLHELAHYVQAVSNDNDFNKCYNLINSWKGDIMEKVEELKFNPTHKVNFGFKVMNIFDGEKYHKVIYGMMPKNHKPDLDPKRTIMFDCIEDLSV